MIHFSLTFKGFASLEAKRKFRAPRLSPNNPSPSSNSSLSPREHASILKDATKENDTSIMSCSETPSVQHSENEDNAPLPIDMVSVTDGYYGNFSYYLQLNSC